MQQSKNLPRLLRALSRQGLQLSYQEGVYSVRFSNSFDSPLAEVLLPEELIVEGS